MSDLENDALFKLNVAIHEYFESILGDVDEPFYIDEWAVVVNLGAMSDGKAYEYFIESNVPHMPPHRIKGLFQEGIQEVDRIRFDYEDDD